MIVSGDGNSSFDILAMGEPLAEFAAEQPGALGEVCSFRRGWGGDTSNLVIAAARLGARCGYISRVGEDEFGESFLSLWSREGIDTSAVTVDPEGFTGVYFVTIDSQGEREFTYYRRESAASRLRPDDVHADHLDRGRIFHVSGITHAISTSARRATDHALALADRSGMIVSYDANIRPALRPVPDLLDVFERSLPLVDVLFLSEQDAQLLYPDQDLDTILSTILTHGPEVVALTRGPRGCLVATQVGAFHDLPAHAVEPVDTTGAGDAWAGAFLVEWLNGASPEEAARFANVVAALASCGLGAVPALPRRQDVERYLP
jgi:2-dehydro-3-deoxygluconokinase